MANRYECSEFSPTAAARPWPPAPPGLVPAGGGLWPAGPGLGQGRALGGYGQGLCVGSVANRIRVLGARQSGFVFRFRAVRVQGGKD